MDAQNPAQPQNPTFQPAAVPIPEQPSVPKPKSSKWIVVAIIVLALVIAGSTGAYLLNKNSITKTQNAQTAVNPTAVPTAMTTPAVSWKTYTNTKHNFSVEYPSDWGFREFPDSKNGAAFNPKDKPGYPDASESIIVSTGVKNGDYIDTPLEDYAKVAANKEIQNYNDLASIKKITTAEGIVGYETTWMVQPITIMGRPPDRPDSESSPITYFELPGDKTSLLRVSLGNEEDLAIYEKMLTTLKFVVSAKSQLTPTQSPTSIPVPTINEESTIIKAIKDASIAKHGGDGSSLEITVSQITGNYAKGGISDEGGGGMWFAEKVNGVWKLVWDGNGVILCTDLTSYPDFPVSMIPECYNETTQDTVKR